MTAEMRPALVRLGTLVMFLAPAVAPAACSNTADGVQASVGATFLVPHGILTKAARLELRVLEGRAECAPDTGVITFPDGEAGAREIAKSDLGSQGCADNVRFCGDVFIRKSAAARVFEAKAFAGETELAFGCTAATIDHDAVPIAIKMLRFLAPPVCGDGTLQPTEQCESSGAEGCDTSCQSTEILLSTGSSDNKTSTGKAGDKTDPAFLWPDGSDDAGRFLGFFTDRAVPSGTPSPQIGLRVLSPTLTTVAGPPALASGSIFLPNGSAASTAKRSLPRAVAWSGKYYVVFTDESGASADIRLRVLTSVVDVDGDAAPVGINGGDAGEDETQTAPSIAAGKDHLFIAWQDDSDGTIAGRTVTPGSLALGNQNQISSGSGNTRPELAATSKGWVVVWTSGTGIKLRALDGSGTPSGGEQAVSDGSGATGGRVASLPDGRFAVAWSNGGDIFVQRYDERGIAVAGDKATPLNDVVKDGAQTQPAIGAIASGGGGYVVAWHDASTGHIRARFLGGSSGFLFNNVNGQATEFQASRVDGRDRATPVVASGGGGPYVAIGWEDKSASGAGIVARRFPLPTD